MLLYRYVYLNNSGCSLINNSLQFWSILVKRMTNLFCGCWRTKRGSESWRCSRSKLKVQEDMWFSRPDGPWGWQDGNWVLFLKIALTPLSQLLVVDSLHLQPCLLPRHDRESLHIQSAFCMYLQLDWILHFSSYTIMCRYSFSVIDRKEDISILCGGWTWCWAVWGIWLFFVRLCAFNQCFHRV
jgi:hypothetical protein